MGANLVECKSKFERHEMELINLAEFRVRNIIREEQVPLRTDITEIRTDMAEIKFRVGNLEGDVAVIKSDITNLKAEVSRIGICLEHVESKLDKVLEVLSVQRYEHI